MRIKLPKHIRGTYFPRITALELNQFDVDLLLPSLFFRLLAEGNGRARRMNDPTAIAGYIRALAQHPAVEGFSEPSGERLLQRFVRTSLTTTGRIGQRRHGEQILAVVPYSILAHKTGLPSEGSRQRNVDTFLYEALRERSGSEYALRQFATQVFGKGVRLNPLPQLGGCYDGQTPLDTMTRLSLAFLDGFQATAVGRSLGRTRSEACPTLVSALGYDLQRYLYAYHERMPSQALTYHLLGIINFELFAYTLKLVHAINQLVQDPSELPAAMRDVPTDSPPELYLDFTGEPGGLSQQMAAGGVRRDLEAFGQYLSSSVLLRLLDRYADALHRNVRSKARMEIIVELGRRSAPEYLQALLLMEKDPELGWPLDSLAQIDEDAIRQTNRQEDEGLDDLSWLDALLPEHLNLTPVQRVHTLLVEGQRRAVQRSAQWFWGTGGLLKSHGVLAGTLRGRRAWRYQPSNDVLGMLVQLAAVHPASGQEPPQVPRRVPLRQFLDFLYGRFGILVDRPPSPYEGAEAVAAARENLRAMLRRLRQMGIFRDLSDDFTVQALTPPYGSAEERAESDSAMRAGA